MMKRNFLAAAVAALAVQSAMPAAAEDADKCCFRLTPYYWAVGIDGNLEINDEQGSTDIDFNQDIGDVTDNLEFNGSLMLEHNKGNWSNFAAVDYIKTENDDTDINVAGSEIEVEADTLLATAATGYRFGAGGDSWVDLLVDARSGSAVSVLRRRASSRRARRTMNQVAARARPMAFSRSGSTIAGSTVAGEDWIWWRLRHQRTQK